MRLGTFKRQFVLVFAGSPVRTTVKKSYDCCESSRDVFNPRVIDLMTDNSAVCAIFVNKG